MSAHTPGPWRQCGGFTPAYGAVHSSSGYIVFGMADSGVHTEQGRPIQAPCADEQFANRRLIAAAPDLLDALADLMRNFPTDGDLKEAGWDDIEIEAACQAHDRARAIYAKATGAQQ